MPKEKNPKRSAECIYQIVKNQYIMAKKKKIIIEKVNGSDNIHSFFVWVVVFVVLLLIASNSSVLCGG